MESFNELSDDGRSTIHGDLCRVVRDYDGTDNTLRVLSYDESECNGRGGFAISSVPPLNENETLELQKYLFQNGFDTELTGMALIVIGFADKE